MVPSGGYVFQTIDDPNAAFCSAFEPGTDANGVNARGQIVGSYFDANGLTHGFLLSGGQYTTLDDPNGFGTIAHGINDRGQIVGEYVDNNNLTNGFLLSGGKYTNLDDPNGSITAAYGINSRGQIVGLYQDANGIQHGFLLSNGQYTTIDDPNVGNFPFGSGTLAQGINDQGQIVGTYEDASGTFHGFLLSGGQYTTLDGSAYGINSRGDIVGGGFLLSHGQYTTLDDPNGVFASANGIDSQGQIVGTYYDNTVFQAHGFLATPQDGGHAQSDAALTGSSLTASQASSGGANVFLTAAAVTNSMLPANQEIHVSIASGANHGDDSSRMPSGQTAVAATLPSTLHGSGDQVVSAAAAGKHSARTGDYAFAHIDAVFADILLN